MTDTTSTFDPKTAAQVLGLSSRQKILAFALMRGATQTAAAIEAGYTGDPRNSSFRKSCSSKANAKKVRRFLEWAATGKGIPDKPGTLDEIQDKLWKQVRSHDLVAQGRAIEQLIKLGLIAGREPGYELLSPEQALEKIAEISPELATALPAKEGMEFKPPADILARAEDSTKKIAQTWIRANAEEAKRFAEFFVSKTHHVANANGAA
jgi:hypothetical protein